MQLVDKEPNYYLAIQGQKVATVRCLQGTAPLYLVNELATDLDAWRRLCSASLPSK